jgi:hypothetical protein
MNKIASIVIIATCMVFNAFGSEDCTRDLKEILANPYNYPPCNYKSSETHNTISTMTGKMARSETDKKIPAKYCIVSYNPDRNYYWGHFSTRNANGGQDRESMSDTQAQYYYCLCLKQTWK